MVIDVNAQDGDRIVSVCFSLSFYVLIIVCIFTIQTCVVYLSYLVRS
jgi:hypothetical protein